MSLRNRLFTADPERARRYLANMTHPASWCGYGLLFCTALFLNYSIVFDKQANHGAQELAWWLNVAALVLVGLMPVRIVWLSRIVIRDQQSRLEAARLALEPTHVEAAVHQPGDGVG